MKLFVAALLVATVVRSQETPTFQTGVFLIHTDAEVIGADRRPVMGLNKTDFRVLDDGQEQTIVAISAGEQPLDLILLFDISGSMRRQVKKVAEVAHQGLEQLRKGDRVSVMAFNREARVINPFTDDFAVTEEAINRVLALRFGGGTAIQHAVQEAAHRFLWFDDPDPKRRRAVIVITDDLGIPSRHKNSIIESLWEADASVSGLVVPNHAALAGLLSPIGSTRPGGVEEFAEKTGGDMIRSQDLGTSFPEMMHRIRNRYILYYKLPEGQVGSLRKVEVRLSSESAARFPGAHIIARRAYRLRERDQYGFGNRN